MSEAHYLVEAIERLIDAKLEALRNTEAHTHDAENVTQAVSRAKSNLWTAIERVLAEPARVR